MTSTGVSDWSWRDAPRNERGVALISALSALLLLTPLVLALLSVSTFEFLISRNLVHTTQALYDAEAGIEWAFNLLVNTPDWSLVVPDPADAASSLSDRPLPSLPASGGAALVAPAGLLPTGTTVTVRPDAQPSALAITATGVVRGAQRTIEAVIKRDPTGSAGVSGSPSAAQGVFTRHALGRWRERQ